MPVTMATSERRCALAGSSGPREACTEQVESSTETNCSPLAWTSFSVRPRVGRISAVSPQTRCERLILVEICTVSRARRSASAVTSVSGRGLDEVAAEADEDVGLAVPQGPDRVDGVVAVLARRVEAELGLQRVQEVLRRPLPDAHRPVALHVGVAADRQQSGARLADVALGEGQVGDLLDGGHRVAVLGQPHRPAEDGGVGVARASRAASVICARVSPVASCDLIPVEPAGRARARPRNPWCRRR